VDQNILGVLATVAAVQILVNQAMSHSNCDVLELAKEYIRQKYPSFDSSGLKLVVSERENFSEVTFELPKGMLGGVPIVTIDKRSCKVIHAEHTQ
jgi:hypothetical protein